LPRQLKPESHARDEAARQSGRNRAFRRKVLEIHDYQCAACGLRIKMPEVSDLTFVDAAHLIPFSESQNDHPNNGLALCKNHHWAMDRHLIAPAPMERGKPPPGSSPTGHSARRTWCH